MQKPISAFDEASQGSSFNGTFGECIAAHDSVGNERSGLEVKIILPKTPMAQAVGVFLFVLNGSAQ